MIGKAFRGGGVPAFRDVADNQEASDQAGFVEAKSQRVDPAQPSCANRALGRHLHYKVTRAVRGGSRTRVFGARDGAWPSTNAQRGSQPAPCRRPLKNYISERWCPLLPGKGVFKGWFSPFPREPRRQSLPLSPFTSGRRHRGRPFIPSRTCAECRGGAGRPEGPAPQAPGWLVGHCSCAVRLLRRGSWGG